MNCDTKWQLATVRRSGAIFVSVENKTLNWNCSTRFSYGIKLADSGVEAKIPQGGTMRIRLNKKGFTLIELLIVVAIIGIIAAIAIPNLLNAIQRGKQKRTMADMRAIGTAVEAFAVDNNRYPDSASPVSNITDDLEPIYIKKLPGN